MKLMNLFLKNLKQHTMRKFYSLFVALFFLGAQIAHAQTDIRISGSKVGFPIALPQLCDANDGAPHDKEIPEGISRNLDLTGIFRIVKPSSFVESPGKCSSAGRFAYTDWSVIGADWLVQGEVSGSSKNMVVVRLFLHDVVTKRAVLGKQYRAEVGELRKIINKFSDEIMRVFTGERGIFGTKLAYVNRVGRFKELFVMNVDGSNPKQLTEDKGLAISPSWSPAGDRLVYTSYRTRRPELYLIAPSGGKPTRVTTRPGLELGAEFSPDGTILISSARSAGDSNLVLFDFRGNVKKQLTRGSAINVSPSWSPDGSHFVFCSNRAGGPQIYRMNAEGGSPKRISFVKSNYCTSPAYSPKGGKIAFVCRSRGNQLFVSDTQGRNPVQMTFAGNNEDPSWSPDGNFLAFNSTVGRGGGKNIFILSLISGVTKQITFTKSESSQPVWSPYLD